MTGDQWLAVFICAVILCFFVVCGVGVEDKRRQQAHQMTEQQACKEACRAYGARGYEATPGRCACLD